MLAKLVSKSSDDFDGGSLSADCFAPEPNQAIGQRRGLKPLEVPLRQQLRSYAIL
jgi:hypothetical protein